MPTKASTIAEWIKRYLKEEDTRSKSLIVSVFGDSIAPRSAGIWLGDLISLLAPFGVSERLVRTSSFRLIEEDWLEARRDGRESYYSLTASGTRRFELAYGRIYTPPQEQWDGSWTMVILPRNGETTPDRMELRRELEWEGFASPTPGVMLHPAANHPVLKQILADLGLTDRAVVLQAHSLPEFSSEPISTLIERSWDLSDVRDRYEKFVARFQPLQAKLEQTSITPQQAFVVQTLLIHSFRRVTLHDPRLPISMLPAEWPGLSAYKLCRQIYQLTYRLAQSHLESVSEAEETSQSPSKLSMRVQQRFGGLR
ncbi:MAG: phenylacetic acid degradation operon negative regulatory protein PaaX [Panacagrimonas sp.]